MITREDLNRFMEIKAKVEDRATSVVQAMGHSPDGWVQWEYVDEDELEHGHLPYAWTECYCGDCDEHSINIPLRYIFAPEDKWREMVRADMERKAREEAARKAREEAARKAHEEARERAEYERLKAKYG